jgi:hypothetical protein
MAEDVWRRPRIPTGESVAAALSLAKTLKPDASLLCEGADGTTELLVRKDGYVERYVAYDSGATQRLERRDRSRRYRVGKRLLCAGLAAIPAILAAGVAFKPDNSSLWMGVPLLLAWGLVMCGGLVADRFSQIDVPDGVVCARIPHALGGWAPRTVAQLAAVEQLSRAGDANESARVRNLADGGVEVETFRKRERRRHVLDAFGAVLEKETSLVPGGSYWATKLAAALFVLPVLALVLLDGLRFFVGAVAVYVLALFVAARIDRRKRLAPFGAEWFKVQVEAPSGD